MRRRVRHIAIAAFGGLLVLGTGSFAAAQTDGQGELPEPSSLGSSARAQPEATTESGSDSKSEEESDASAEAVEGEAENDGGPAERLPPADETTDGPPGDRPGSVPAAEGEAPSAVPESGVEKGAPAPKARPDAADEGDDRPPIQVRRAVDAVESRAQSVAGSVAGERLSGEDEPDSGAESDGSEPRVRRLDRDARGAAEESSGPSGESTAEAAPSTADLFGEMRGLFRDSNGTGLVLDPHVDDPRWERAMQLVVENECREALDRVDTVIDASDRDLKQIPAVRYAIARVKMCAGRGAEGRKTLRELKKREDVVGELARRRLGGAPPEIRSDRAEPADWSDHIRRARELARDGRLDEARERLSEIRDGLDRAFQRYKVSMTEANLLLREGRVDEAARRLVEIYRMTRDWSVGDRVSNKIERVEQRHGVDILSMGDRVDRMRELIARRKYRKAKKVSIENAEVAGVSGREVRGWSKYRRGLQAEQKRRREKAAALFESAESLVRSPVIRSRLYFGWARALRRLDRDDEAVELYRRLCREYPRHHLCDDARFEVGRLLQYGGDHKAARRAFADLVGMHPESEHVAEALWRGAFSAYLSGAFERVDRPLRRLIEEYPDETDSSGLRVALKARYWLGVAAFRRGEIDTAERRFQETINQGAWTWYGRLAAARMERIGAEPVVPKSPGELSSEKVHEVAALELPDRERFRVAAAYARLGLYDDAIEEMKRQIDVSPVPSKSHRFLANLLLADDRRAAAHWMMHERIEGTVPTRETLRDWGLAYPFEFREPARRYATEYGVSPYLVQGIMRQESGFRPAVSSGVGAVGLMQLMPGTANAIADEFFGGAYVSRSQLQEPGTNIRLGTAYIRAMLARVQGRAPMALAGYNAGPAPLEDWFERFGDRNMDAWVESITYRQARGYVRKVYTSYTRYAALYEGSLPDVELQLPEQFDTWGEVPELKNRDADKRPVSLLR